MKKIYLSTLLSFTLVFVGLRSSATVWDVNVSNNVFTPGILNVIVGDTVRWHLLQGNHTTTSVSVPGGAASWDFTMSSTTNLFEYVVTVEGNYVYVCSFHSGMSGQIVATGSTGISSPVADLNFNISYSGDAINFSYSLYKSSNVNLSLIDVTGKLARTLVSEVRGGGDYFEKYYLSDLKRGIYIVQMLTDNQRLTRRIVIE